MAKNVCVIFGGVSSEHEISCISASYVIENLDRELYNVYNLGITKEGRWYLYKGGIERIRENTWDEDKENLSAAIISPDKADGGIIVKDTGKAIKIDVMFPVIHGYYGEDGSIQGLLRLSGIRFVGMDILSSGLCLDKHYTKTICAQNGIKQADWVCVLKEKWNDSDIIKIERLGYPVFVKPANTGSSIGISKAKNREELIEAIKKAFIYDRKVIVEEFISGREVECSVIGDYDKRVASCVGELKPEREFYDYEAKYVENTTKLIIPAGISEDIAERVRELAVKIFDAFDGFGLSRVDFFVCEKGDVVFNEINTMPGFTEISMFPKLLEHSGIPYKELLTRLIEISENRPRMESGI